MASRIRVGIAGTGSYVPERVVPNKWFEEFLLSRQGVVQFQAHEPNAPLPRYREDLLSC